MILFCLLLWLGPAPAPARAEEPYVVAPVQGAQDLRLLPASAWHPGDADQNEMLLKLSYLRGVLDALQYVQLAPKSSAQALTQLKGLGLGELAASLDQYYLADPRRRELPPISVLLRILPQAAAQAGEKAAEKTGEAPAPPAAPPQGGKPSAPATPQPAPPAASPAAPPEGQPPVPPAPAR
ncbi:MAG: hypothetical protein HY794_14650 [Desulfarculus sp.]|nr:hypothetical protein [Desulfarculus sp.]